VGYYLFKAWLCLGITQTENEKDGLAIYALKKYNFLSYFSFKVSLIYRCIEFDSKNLQAYITLASCYTNEMLKTEAFDSLYKWLANNNKYSHLLSNHQSYSMYIIFIFT